MERNSQFMSLPKSMVDALQKEEMLLVAGGSVGQEICLQHITGEYQSKTTTIDGSFHSVTKNHYKDQKFRPWAILRYTFRKNADKKHKLGKVLDSTEEGISILR